MRVCVCAWGWLWMPVGVWKKGKHVLIFNVSKGATLHGATQKGKGGREGGVTAVLGLVVRSQSTAQR